MQFLVFLPLIPAIWWVAARSAESAFLNFYLPIMVIVPAFYVASLPHMMSINAHDAALLPIVIVALIKYGREWRLRRSDFWIFLFILGAGYAAGRDHPTEGIRAFFETTFAVFFPYAIGRLLLSRGDIGIRFLRRLSWLVAVVAILSLVEFFSSHNLFTRTFDVVFGQTQPNIEQLRGGFTRAQGPFMHAISAGIMYASAWIFALWLRYYDRTKPGSIVKKFLGIRRSTVLVCLLFMGLLIAYSRGPWIGALLSFGIWWVARAKDVRKTAIIVTLIGVIVGSCLYVYLNGYTSGIAQTEDQQNAIYRRQLLDAYGQIADEGGIFGWGIDFPRLAYQSSIDNQYLFLHLTQGLVGLWTFLLLSVEAGIALVLAAYRRRTQALDFTFALSLLAVLSGMLLTLLSVYLSAQAQELFFFCVGWSMSLRPFDTADSSPAQTEPDERQFRFQRTFA